MMPTVAKGNVSAPEVGNCMCRGHDDMIFHARGKHTAILKENTQESLN